MSTDVTVGGLSTNKELLSLPEMKGDALSQTGVDSSVLPCKCLGADPARCFTGFHVLVTWR